MLSRLIAPLRSVLPSGVLSAGSIAEALQKSHSYQWLDKAVDGHDPSPETPGDCQSCSDIVQLLMPFDTVRAQPLWA